MLALLAALTLAGPITLDPSVRKEFSNCSSGGSAAQTLTADRRYLMRITDEDVYLCFASSGSTCSSGGERFPMNTVVLMYITSDLKSVSCRSTNSTGDAIFTKSDSD